MDVLAMLGDERRTQLDELLAQLREDLGANKGFDGLFRGVFGVNVYLKLGGRCKSARGCTEWMGYKKGTYDVLIFLGIMGYLWYCDTAVCFLGLLGLACRAFSF